jgi:DNA replication and repair protein RecF
LNPARTRVIASPVSRYQITRLTLTDFRNYESLRLQPAKPLVALAGPNGAGKTNILEAISLLMPGRGLRGVEFAELARRSGAGSWGVSADAENPDGEMQLGTAWSKPENDDESNASRAVMRDGIVQKSAGTLTGLLRILWLTPAMDRLFAGAPGDRRRFLDRSVALFDPEHGTRVNAFEKLMRERNLLLQEQGYDRTWISSLEAQMAEKGVAISAARLEAAGTLGRFLAEPEAAGPFPWGTLMIEGDAEALVASRPSLQAEDAYRLLLAESRTADRAAGRALVGPHRSDLLVTYGPKNMPAYNCSTGEQKALLIGLILAQARAAKTLHGAAPILLLDEIAAHLDKARRIGLFELLTVLESQVFMTGTDTELFDGAGASAVVYQVDNGHLRESLSQSHF